MSRVGKVLVHVVVSSLAFCLGHEVSERVAPIVKEVRQEVALSGSSSGPARLIDHLSNLLRRKSTPVVPGDFTKGVATKKNPGEYLPSSSPLVASFRHLRTDSFFDTGFSDPLIEQDGNWGHLTLLVSAPRGPPVC